jgi:hypothetical protein
MAGITFTTPILAVLSTPQRILDFKPNFNYELQNINYELSITNYEAGARAMSLS